MMSSKEAEQSVLGSMLIDPKKVMPIVIHSLTAKDFEFQSNQNLFQICVDLYIENKPIDAVTVLSKYGDTTEARQYVIGLVECTPSAANIEQYVSIVEQLSKRRNAYGMAIELTSMLSTDEPLDACSSAVQAIQSVLNHKVDGVELDAENGFYQAYIAMDKDPEYIETGFSGIDLLAQISRGDYIVIGARPSTGKTALTLQMAMNMARKYRVIYFSLETSALKLYQRMLACYTGIPLEKMKHKGDVETMTRLNTYYSRFKQLNIKVVEAAGWTVEKIKAKAMEEKADIIFVDYLSLISSRGKDKYEQTTNISIGLHTMAQTSKISVVALSQLSRKGAEREPDMTDLRESGQIEQDADVIILLSKDDGTTDRKLTVAKNKDGKTGTMTLGFNGEIQRFMEYETRY